MLHRHKIISKFKHVVIILVFTFIVSGCLNGSDIPQPESINSTLTPAPTSSQQLKNVTTQLIIESISQSSNKGRLVGDEGNEAAGKYIEDTFKQLGIKPLFSDSYKWGYEQFVYDPSVSNPQIELFLKDGTSRKLEFGKDFSMNTTFGELNKRFSTDEDLKALEKIFNPREPLPIMCVPVESFDKVNVYVTKETYNSIDWNNVNEVTIKNNFSKEEKTVHNIVGYIEGKNRNKAIILTAHYDGVGYIGETYTTAAIDNASGVAAIARAANVIVSSNVQPETDIIFVAFNGEEPGFFGSKAFAKEIKEKYTELVNINVDCVGSRDRDFINLSSSDRKLCKNIDDSLSSYLKEQGIDNSFGPYYSDHLSFGNENIANITLSQNDLISSIHSEKDVPNVLDYTEIDKIGNLLADFINNSTDKIFIN